MKIPKQKRKVIAIPAPSFKTGTQEAYIFDSMADCCEAYGLRYQYLLEKLIETGATGPDGRTTFDWAMD